MLNFGITTKHVASVFQDKLCILAAPPKLEKMHTQYRGPVSTSKAALPGSLKTYSKDLICKHSIHWLICFPSPHRSQVAHKELKQLDLKKQ